MPRFERETLERFIRSLHFPLTKQEILNEAKARNLAGPAQLLLRQMADRKYKDGADAYHALPENKAVVPDWEKHKAS